VLQQKALPVLASGETLPNSMARCDYIADCADESDERGCALSCD
jgi:hypothetical protein